MNNEKYIQWINCCLILITHRFHVFCFEEWTEKCIKKLNLLKQNTMQQIAIWGFIVNWNVVNDNRLIIPSNIHNQNWKIHINQSHLMVIFNQGPFELYPNKFSNEIYYADKRTPKAINWVNSLWQHFRKTFLLEGKQT